MKILFWFLVGLMILLPLVRWDVFMFAATFTKATLFQMSIEMVLVWWLWQGGLSRLKEAWRARSFLSWALLAWLATMVISSLFAYDPAAAWWSGYERMMGMIVWLHLFAFLALLITIGEEQRQWEYLFTAVALSGVVVALIGIAEKFFGSDIYSNVGSTLSNSAFLGSFLVLIFFIIARQCIKKEKFNIEVTGWLFALFCVFLAILFTEARSALVGILGGGFVMALMLAWQGIARPIVSISSRWVRRMAFTVVIAVIAVIGGTFLLRNTLKDSPVILLSRIGSVYYSGDRTGSGRLLAWGVGWEAFKERPLFGWGVENFSFAFNAHYDPRLYNVEPWFDRAHNALVDWGVTTGMIGLGAYLAVFSAAFLRAWREKEYALAGLFAAMFAQNMVTFDILSTYAILFVVLAYSMRDPTFIERARTKTNNRAGLIGLALLIPVFFFAIWKPLRENMIAQAAGEAFAKGDDARAYQLVERSLSYRTYGDIEMRRLVAEYVFEFLKKGGRRDPDAMTALYDFAITHMEENGVARAGDAKWPAYGAALNNLAYAHTHDISYAERAATAARESLALSPGRQQHWLELAQALLAQKKEKEYFEAIDTAIGLMPRYPIPHLNGAAGAIALDAREREAREIEWLRSTTWDILPTKRDSWDNPGRDFEELVQVYYKVKRFPDAIAYQERLTEERKKEGARSKILNALIQLAALYKEAGRFAEARKTAQEIISIEPSMAQEAETFLRSLELK